MSQSPTVSTQLRPSSWLWIGLIGLASLALSRAFACATPFAALATLAAFTLPRRQAIALVLFTWIANQAVGFGLLHYPWTASTAAWGLAIGVASAASLFVAMGVARQTVLTWWSAPLALIAGFAAYEVVLLATALLLSSGTSAFSAAIVVRIFAINAVALGVLVVAERLARQATYSHGRVAG